MTFSSFAHKVWQRGMDLFPIQGFHFDRPIVLLQSDDWGRAGLRDREGLEQLRAEGLNLGEGPYDLYTLETADDLAALRAVLNRHCDTSGRSACMVMNFILANLDFARMSTVDVCEIHFLPLADGLPKGWNRPGLLEAYHEGIAAGAFYPALHGTTHFCRPAIERHMVDPGERGVLLRKLWRAGTPYIFWRMPWIGYEYWDPEQPAAERFLPRDSQQQLIGKTVGAFTKFFSTVPRSACAPGYRANRDTHRAWAQYGIRTAQNGPGTFTPPHLDRHGMLQMYRTVNFEPAMDAAFSLEACVSKAERCFQRGIPAIISVHSVNFHSSVQDSRSGTLARLDELLSALERAHPDLLYLHDEDLYELVHKGFYETSHGTTSVHVTRKTHLRALAAR
jgi:hypothetical protein